MDLGIVPGIVWGERMNVHSLLLAVGLAQTSGPGLARYFLIPSAAR